MVPNETKETEQKKSFFDKFLENVLFNSIFPVIDWIDKLHDFDEEICFPCNGYHGNGKKHKKK